jgi:HTH-type transcriptional regulator, competence development regulator
MADSLADFLRGLRQESGMTLREVEQATGGAVSNVYLSQLENGRRNDPNPRYLVALAQVYGVPAELLFERAGYVTPPEPSAVEIAFRQVLADPSFKFGTRFKGALDDEGKRFVIELYERATGKRLLTDANQ